MSIFDFNSGPSAYQQTGGYQPIQNSQPSSGNVTAPKGTQDQYDAYLGGQPSKPLSNSATGKPLDNSGQVDESQVDKRTIWSRLGMNGALGRGLNTAALVASMVPQGNTIGENISGVAGALHNLPYAELLHQYQLSQPGMERAKEMSGINLQRAQTQEALQRGEYYSGRNQASILAQQQRGQSAEQLRLQASQPKMTWGQAPEDGGDPGSGVTWKKGQKTWGRDMPEYVPGNPNDPTDPGSVKHNFTPISLEDEEMKARWGMGGGGSYEQHYTNLYTQTYPQGKSGKITDPVELQQEALDDYKLHNNTLPGQAILGAHIDAPQSKAEQEKEASSQQAKADDEAYTRLRKTKPGQSEEQSLQNDTIAWATAQNSADPNEKKAAGDDPFAYHTKMQQANQEHDAQMDTARASYLAQPASKRKGFVPYLLANGYDPKTRSFTQASQQPQIQNQGGTPGSDNNIYWDGKNYRKHSDGSIVQ